MQDGAVGRRQDNSTWHHGSRMSRVSVSSTTSSLKPIGGVLLLCSSWPAVNHTRKRKWFFLLGKYQVSSSFHLVLPLTRHIQIVYSIAHLYARCDRWVWASLCAIVYLPQPDENFQLFVERRQSYLDIGTVWFFCHSYTDPFFNLFSAWVGVGWDADRIFSLSHLNGPPNRRVDDPTVMTKNLVRVARFTSAG